jgi:type VI secretion system protein ImpF
VSGNRLRPESGRQDVARRAPARPQLALLDRLIDDAPEKSRDEPMSPTEALQRLRASVRRDVEALLNARRRWRSWPASLNELTVSPLNFGIPDCSGGTFHGQAEREVLRREIEDTLRRFEPRFRSVHVTLSNTENRLDTTLRLRIDAMLHAEPAPEPITFDTIVDPATADVLVRSQDDV